MGLAFTVVNEVQPGHGIELWQVATQARSRNDRLRHLNGAWRYHFWHQNFWRQVRRPVDSENPATQWPAQGEAMEFYIHLTPETGLLWPEEDGQGEANHANPAVAWAFGPEELPELSEVDRLSCIPGVNLEAECPRGVPTLLPGYREPVTKKDYWDLGMMQRGGIDLGAQVSGARMLDTAVAYFQILMGFSLVHHKCFGGYAPAPEVVGYCEDGDGSTPQTANQAIFFTGIDRGPDTKPPKYYAGTCPPIPEDARPDHIRWIAETPRAWYVVLNDGRIDIVSKKDYIEGPYRTGGRYRKLDGQQYLHAMNAWLAEFRGDATQRALGREHNEKIAEHAAPFRKFLRAQYFGAPQKATWNGTSLQLQIPRFTLNGGAGLKHAVGTRVGGLHFNRGGFVTGGIYAKGTKLAKAVTVRVLNGGRQFYQFTLQPGTETGGPADSGEFLYYFDSEMEMTISGLGAQECNPLEFQLGSELEFTQAGGELAIEATDQLRYRPELDDIYLLLRLATGNGDEGKNGDEVQDANMLWEAWAKNGCVVSAGLASDGLYVNKNKPVEVMRRWTRRTTRTITRENFIGYAVQGGKSVLWFKRHYKGLDVFEGIAPSLTPLPEAPSGTEQGIIAGVKYWVRTNPDNQAGSVIYNGQAFSTGQEFTGVAGVRGYTSASGGARVYRREGIVHPTDAMPKKGWSNEWVGWAETFPYSNGLGNNQFYPGSFADYLFYFQRCHFYSPKLDFTKPELYRHMAYGQRPVLAVEAPDSYNFAEGLNSGGSEYENTSCQMYQPPPEVESAISYAEGGHGEVVQLTFRGRFQHCPDAPAAIARDRSTWSAKVIGIETYRTAENAMREYLLHMDSGGADPEVGEAPGRVNCTKNKPGDGAVGNAAWESFSNLWGSCYPRFFFVKLAEEPAFAANIKDVPAGEDGKAHLDLDPDGLVEQVVHWSMIDRAITPMFADSETSKAICDGTSSLMDFTTANLNYQAHGIPWVPALPKQATWNGFEHGRDDQPFGLGPLPRCIGSAEIFNKFARNINAMRRVRIMGDLLTFKVKRRVGVKAESTADEPVVGDECLSKVGKAELLAAVPATDVPLTESEDECGGDCVINASESVSLYGHDCWWEDGSYQKLTSKETTEWAFVPEDREKLAKLHPEVRELFSGGHGYLMAVYREETVFHEEIVVTTEEESWKCSDQPRHTHVVFWNPIDNRGVTFKTHVATKEECRFFPLSGLLEAHAPPGVLALCKGFNDDGQYFGGPGQNYQTKTISIAAGSVPFVEVPLKVYKREEW